MAEIADDVPAAVAAEPISSATEFRGKFKEWLCNIKQRAEAQWPESVKKFEKIIDDPCVIFESIWGSSTKGLGCGGESSPEQKVSVMGYVENVSRGMSYLKGNRLIDLEPRSVHRARKSGQRGVEISPSGDVLVQWNYSSESADLSACDASASSSQIVPAMSEFDSARAACAELEAIVADHLVSCGRDCNTSHTNPCDHVQRVLSVVHRYRHRQRTFPACSPFSCGNAWILNSVLPMISPFMGNQGRMVLAEEWNVRVRGGESVAQALNADVVRSMLVDFLASRPSLASFEFYFDDDIGIQPLAALKHEGYGDVAEQLSSFEGLLWFRVPFKETLMSMAVTKYPDVQRAWHGCKWESLASMLAFGLRASGPDEIGSRHQTEAGLYCCSDNYCSMAAGYCNTVPSSNDNALYWSCLWELDVDRFDRIVCKRRHQWQQKLSSVCRRALWVRVARFQDLPDGEPIQAFWEPLFEYRFRFADACSSSFQEGEFVPD